ncbi:MAG: NUDIX hydrolase [Gammaproteobacteria bacterium]|nr:MAG: NUDIX hydrolase [Gammaproteobacteria bacterium]
MAWKPHVTVAALVEREGRYLLVEESVDGRRVLNQPAGHLEPGEGLLDAVVREMREETGRDFEPRSLVGIYLWRRAPGAETFLRFVFFGMAGEEDPSRRRDPEILATHWLTERELRRQPERLRSPLVLRCIEDHLACRHYPLDFLETLLDQP